MIGNSRSERKRARMAAAAASRPTLSGVFGVGNTLTANPGSWAPSGSVITYQWVRGKDSIAGATANQYILTSQDAGKQISCLIKASHQSVGSLIFSLSI